MKKLFDAKNGASTTTKNNSYDVIHDSQKYRTRIPRIDKLPLSI